MPILLVLAFLLLVATGPASANEAYRRATVLEDRIGRVEVRSAYGTRLTLPVECQNGEEDCVAERVYDEVMRLDFISQDRRDSGEEVLRTEQEAGTILLAVNLAPDDLETFRSEILERLHRLSAQAFAEPFAGWGYGKPPFDSRSSLATMSEEPSWVCFEPGTGTLVARFGRRQTEDGTSTYSGSTPEPPTPLCAEMAAATEGVYPEVIETLPVPGRLLEVAVYHDDVTHLDTRDHESTVRRPEGVVFMKRRMPEGVSGSATRSADGVSYAQHGAGDGWRFEAYAEPTAMPISALDDSAWLHRWRIETVEHRLGPDPEDRFVGSTSFAVAYLATVPPIEAGETEERGFSAQPLPPPDDPVFRAATPRIDRGALMDAIVRQLDRYHGSPVEVLEDLVVRPGAGLETDGWIAVVCRDDGTADYHLPPTRARQRVTNADLFCSALEVRLASLDPP